MKIACAVIYVLNQIIGNSDNLLFIKADEKRGKVLYNEIIQNGNFGKYDEGLKGRDEKKLISFNLVAFRRQMKFILYYPWDVISIPFKIGMVVRMETALDTVFSALASAPWEHVNFMANSLCLYGMV